jgi:hypothetical protein
MYDQVALCPRCGAKVSKIALTLGGKAYHCQCGWQWYEKVSIIPIRWRDDDDNLIEVEGERRFTSPTEPPVWLSQKEVENGIEASLALASEERSRARLAENLPKLFSLLERSYPETLAFYRGSHRRHGPTHRKMLLRACREVDSGHAQELKDGFLRTLQ